MKETPTKSQLLEIFRQGKPLEGELVIDSHTHIEPRGLNYYLPDSDLPSIIHNLDRYGIDQICAFSFSGTRSDFTYGNDFVAEAVKQYPDRITGYVTLNANYPHEWIAELDRGRCMGLKGIKLIPDPYQGCKMGEVNLDPIFAYAHENHMIMLCHNWGSEEYLDRISQEFPGACFMTGHFHFYPELVPSRPNVYLNTCAVLDYGHFDAVMRQCPTEKVVFGSDLVDLDPGFSLGPILFSPLSDDDKRKILGLNMKRLLEEYDPPEL